MEAHEAPFSFMKGTISIEIPFFQRAYVWNEENWNDLLENLFDDNSSHFLGSIILKSIPTPSGEQPRWSLVDGQQRLTTLSILLRACYDTFSMKDFTEEDQKQIESDKTNMLTYKTKSIGGETKLKIKHSKVDEPTFLKVIQGDVCNTLDEIILSSETKKEESPSHKIFQCYKFFRNNLDVSHAVYLWNLLLDDNQKILVKIDLSSDENEQAIFDTINSAGVRLTCADTIKNLLFQNLMEAANNKEETDRVGHFYSNTWEETFNKDRPTIDYWAAPRSIGRISRDNLEILLHCVALIENIYDPERHKMSDLPQIYKQHIKSLPNEEIYEFIQRICKYAKTYKRFFHSLNETTSYEFNQPVMRLLHILEVCDISTFHAYILKILKGYEDVEEEEIPNEVLDELHNLETIAVRYTICRESTKNFNKNCAELISGKITTSDLLNNVNVNKDSVAINLRNIKNKYAKLILFWVELKRRFEDTKCTEKDLKYTYSLEHIMPQKWEDYWPISNPPVVEAGNGLSITDSEEAKTARSSAIYEIGNMALLNSSLNTSLRNYDLKKKMDGEGRKKGIRKYGAALLSTSEIIDSFDQMGTWNEQMIRQRTNELTKQVFGIW